MSSSRYFVVGLAISASVLAMACNSSSKTNNDQPGNTVQPQTGPAWTLTLKSNCAAGAAYEQCLAKYGFSVTADGQYRVGPGPQNQFRTGTLSDAQMESIKSHLPALSALAAESHESDVENVSDDSMTYARAGAAEQVIAHNTAGDFYTTLASTEEAKALHGAIRDLANSYYRLPFGDACGDAADKVKDAADAIVSCQADSDCVYIDAYHGFEVIPPSSQQWLLTEDCTAVQPPVVANKLMINAGAHALDEAYGNARTACGAEFQQSSFGHACSFEQKATSVQPVCLQNRCQSRL